MTSSIPDSALLDLIEHMTEEELEELAQIEAAEDADRLARPLAYAELWDQDDPARTSQLRNCRDRLASRALYRFELGGNRCLAGETLLTDAVTGEVKRIDEVFGTINVWAHTPNGREIVQAESVPRKGPDPLYRVELSSGGSFLATALHRVLGPCREWRTVWGLSSGDVLVAPNGTVTVDAVLLERFDYHYDLSVPGWHNYEAAGVVHHNSGKSEGGAIEDWVYALGRDHPDVIAWAALNDIDLDETDIPYGPGVVWAVAPDSNDSRRFVRPKIAKYAPAGSKWRNKDGPGEAEVKAPCGAKIVFKSVDQGRDGFQGDAVRRVRFDEEPKDPAVVNEALMRIADEQGHLAFTMTPLSGWTTLLDEHVREPDEETFVRWLHGTDNPHMSREFLERLYRKFGPHERAARERGEIVALEGRIYLDWRRDLHVVKSFRPPAEWPRFDGIDWGTRNPTCILWTALDPSDDTLHVYRVLYERERTRGWLAREYRRRSGWVLEDGLWVPGPDADVPEWIVADPEDRGARLEWARDYGIITVKADKRPGSVRSGISDVAERLALNAEGRPGIVVHDCCEPFIREIESYVWDTTKTKGDLPDKPLKKNDHAMDDIRYICSRLAKFRGSYLDAVDEEAA